MTVTSRITTIAYTNGLGSGRTFVATATSTDIAAGTSTVVTVTNTALGGAIDPANPDTFTLRYVDDGGTTIGTVTLNTTSASQTDTFFFTTTGLTGGAARVGTIEIKLQVTKTTGGPTNTYDTESDGAPSTPPTGFTASTLNRGWIRSSATRTQSFSNVSAGGAKSLAEYDESLFLRLTAGHTSYVARSLSVVLSHGSLSGSTNSTASPTRDVSFTSVCDNRFPAAATVVTATVTVPNATLTGLPAWIVSSETTDSITVDPRLTAAHDLQLDDGSFGTPPLSKNQSSGQRLTTQIAYLTTHFRAARGTRVGNVLTEGKNSLTIHTELQDSAAATAAITQDEVTATKGGEAGWVQTFLQWTSALPGGMWNKTTSITAPADITGAGYLVGGTATYTLLAIDPNIVLRGYANKTPGGSGPSHHFTHGVDGLYPTLVIVNALTGVRVDPSRVTNVFCTVSRVNPTTQIIEFLDTDETTFITWGATAAQVGFAMAASPADARMYVKSFPAANTATWTRDLRVGFTATIDGTPYYTFGFREETGNDNSHSGNVLDAVGFALTGGLTFK